MWSSKRVLTLLLFLFSLNCIACDYFSSILGLENLLGLEDLYLKSLESHIQQVEKFHKEIERFLDEVDLELKLGNQSSEYFENPINAFKIIKRLTVDWKQMEEFTKTIQSINDSSSPLPEDFAAPTAQDLQGAAKGFARLQRIYKLKAEDIAEGQLSNEQFDEKLTASDCFALGQSLYEAGDHLYASEWLLEAMHRLHDEKQLGIEDGTANQSQESQKHNLGSANKMGYSKESIKRPKEAVVFPTVNAVQILEYIPATLYNVGNTKLAQMMNGVLLSLDPGNYFGLLNKNLYDEGVKKERRLRLVENPNPGKTKLQEVYGPTCSGELQQTPAEKRKLRCRYVTKNLSYYLLGPLKMEELNLDPLIVMYHQAITDNEIDQIISSALSSMARSQVGHVSVSQVSDLRTSKGSWLYHGQHKFLEKISQRLEDITGLTMQTSEALQVANYGIGGHYDPHMDATSIEDKNYIGMRILTALFYINDVQLGGATAFPLLRLAVPPIKNSLVVWHNLHKSGDMDYRTTHAGCPVIKGSKWIANEWFHAGHQELRRLCDLKSDTLPYELFKDYVVEG